MSGAKRHEGAAPALAGAEVLLVDGLRVGYNGAPALDGVSLVVPHGAQVAVVGPNGAGKSTLFKAIVGLLRPAAGRVLIHGRPPGDQADPSLTCPSARRSTGASR